MGYRITGEYRGSAMQAGESESAATALGMYRAAIKPGGLPVTSVRIVDPSGAEISEAELAAQAESERNG